MSIRESASARESASIGDEMVMMPMLSPGCRNCGFTIVCTVLCLQQPDEWLDVQPDEWLDVQPDEWLDVQLDEWLEHALMKRSATNRGITAKALLKFFMAGKC